MQASWSPVQRHGPVRPLSRPIDARIVAVVDWEGTRTHCPVHTEQSCCLKCPWSQHTRVIWDPLSAVCFSTVRALQACKSNHFEVTGMTPLLEKAFVEA